MINLILAFKEVLPFLRRHRNVWAISILMLVVGCGKYASEVNETLEEAKGNRQQLEEVIRHYEQEGDAEKLDAALFLIANMKDRTTITNRSNLPYLEIIDSVASLRALGNGAFMSNSPELSDKWDSITRSFGVPQIRPMDEDMDVEHIKSTYLISHIDQMFRVWREAPWYEKVAFEDFCEYILPYRVGDEKLELWGEQLYKEWTPKIKEENLDSIRKIAQYINDANSYRMSHMRMFWSYPYDFSASEFERIRTGSCKDGVNYTAQVLRALGIPTVVDFVPTWAGASNGHEWNAIFLEDGELLPFDAINRGLKIDLSWRKIGKVYRKTFSHQEVKMDDVFEREVPNELRSPFVKDVTDQYVKTGDVSIPMPDAEGFRYAIISTYSGFDWEPQCWGTIKNKRAIFNKLGVNNLYAVFLYDDGQYIRKSDPFLLDSVGHIAFFKPNYTKHQDMRLERKYPLTPFMEGIMSLVVGNKIQGSNKRDFQDSTTLFTITETPRKMESVVVDDDEAYRYVRMWIPRGGRGDMAELEFYGLSPDGRDTVKLTGDVIGDPKVNIAESKYYGRPFDGDLLTYFLRARGMEPWVGLDLKRKERIVKVRYCPRSDTNFIEVGDVYELFLWGHRGWESQGEIKASDQYLEYKNMPSEGLFILVNKNKGVEHKIFTYRGGQQIWL